MIYELRIYRSHEGQKNVLLREFKKAKRFMAQYGVTFVAAWENPDRDDEFIWLCSLTNKKARDKAIKAYYGSSEWVKIVGIPRPTIRRREVRIMKSLTDSTIRQASLVTPKRIGVGPTPQTTHFGPHRLPKISNRVW